ncbi:hypothetical protein M409DRAFT_71378 [Zasmidium cellare ATCC 36951]|uniref:Serine aminopeptidase S33 domain-containing protein n=1 Tax=Zasmidium cellare ATCC 36951 TaxID=1080233 RepID=A0A6A6BVT4_ZASCE|nr:uncharacterized protein M409DRAFT_71378 [Zasmidium cellare ATCC 36951]KAF2158891.1 hypothetical protein M409DRAFT_71378 [Zasmidium cellare ATCC 36951]
MSPPTHTTTTSNLTLTDGHTLYTKTWSPTTPHTATLIFIHGFSDHCNFYGILFPTLAAQHAIKTYSFDQRGWGRSVHAPKEKGLTGGTARVMSDMTEFIRHVFAQEEVDGRKDVPVFLMGHSMGGAEVLCYLATGPREVLSRIRGFLCESPFVALHESSRPSRLTVALGRLAGRVLPSRQMVNQLEPGKLCRDEEVVRAYEADELCHDTGTLEGLAGMLDRASDLENDKVVVRDGVGEGGKTRLWVGFGTGDQILSERVCREWFGRVEVEDKEFRVYEGWYHKLHAEPGEDKVTFAGDVGRWMLGRCGSLEEGAGGGSAKAKL